MRVKQRIEEVLKHFDYCWVTIGKHDSDNTVNIDFPTTNAIVFRDLTISFGAERVSKEKGKIKVLP